MLLVLGHGMTLTLLGIGLGAAGSYGLTRLMQGQLFGVTPTDPATFISVATLLTLVALVATVMPAWRASRLDPLHVLREE
jgi:ABC-type antimicrobial peptide transport system permease subunit